MATRSVMFRFATTVAACGGDGGSSIDPDERCS